MADTHIQRVILREKKGAVHPYLKLIRDFDKRILFIGVVQHSCWPGTDKGSVVLLRSLSTSRPARSPRLEPTRQTEPVWLKWQVIKSIPHLLPAGPLLPARDGCTPLFHLKAVSPHFSTQRQNNRRAAPTTTLQSALLCHVRSTAFQN